MRDVLARDDKTPALVRPVVDELAQLIMGWVAETESLELGLGLDDVQGLSFAFKVRPRAGTGLAQLVASAKPYQTEPVLASTPAPAFYAAAGASDFFKAMTAAVRKALAGQTDLKAFDALTDAWSGAGSVVVSDADGTSYDIVYAVEPEKSEPLRAWLEGALGPLSLGDLTRDPSLAGVVLLLEKDGDAFHAHFVEGRTKGRKRLDPDALALMRKVTFRFALDGGRFIASAGMAKKDHFERLRAAVRTAPVAVADVALAPVLAATKDALAVEYVDLAALVRMAFGLAGPSAEALHRPALRQAAAFSHLLEGLRLPLHAELRGGDALAITWHLPMETATSAATLGMQLMSGALQAPPTNDAAPSPPPRRRRP